MVSAMIRNESPWRVGDPAKRAKAIPVVVD